MPFFVAAQLWAEEDPCHSTSDEAEYGRRERKGVPICSGLVRLCYLVSLEATGLTTILAEKMTQSYLSLLRDWLSHFVELFSQVADGYLMDQRVVMKCVAESLEAGNMTGRSLGRCVSRLSWTR